MSQFISTIVLSVQKNSSGDLHTMLIPMIMTGIHEENDKINLQRHLLVDIVIFEKE